MSLCMSIRVRSPMLYSFKSAKPESVPERCYEFRRMLFNVFFSINAVRLWDHEGHSSNFHNRNRSFTWIRFCEFRLLILVNSQFGGKEFLLGCSIVVWIFIGNTQFCVRIFSCEIFILIRNVFLTVYKVVRRWIRIWGPSLIVTFYMRPVFKVK